MPKIFADVDRVSEGKTQLVARLIDYGKSRERFGPSDFTLNEVGQLSCPNGQVAAKVYRSGSADGVNYRFLPDQCQDCPLLAQCRGAEVQPDHYRQAGTERSRSVFISHYRDLQRQAILYTQTEQFKLDMHFRSTIAPIGHPIIAALVRYNDARQATALGWLRLIFKCAWRGCSLGAPSISKNGTNSPSTKRNPSVLNHLTLLEADSCRMADEYRGTC